MTELGPAVRTHRTNVRPRGWAAVILFAAGVALGLPGVVLWGIADTVNGKVRLAADPFVVPAAMISLAIGCFGGTVVFGAWAVRHRGEAFEVHDHALRLTGSGRTRVVPWPEIARVVHGQTKDTALTRLTGGDFRCVVHLTDGGKFVVTGLTADARGLVAHVEAGAPQ
ncbi:hypothetical protein H4696_003352 [Amycolatopsis lexingtonensis]|uniref:PH domain-containing protein n=1 Tax=Amycolatopsis lexingtonensis TaxID=218822 RepID=A0ABR9HZY5_9PSEU|nr:hypothetical protein [Amycolatopsis lexingtonensis]MBE1496252.1 hypothetical protein [Amycolatopsis lexingtonensis]